jgi:tetratricopeptide (TPR) repeat protein/O-antigen ligase
VWLTKILLEGHLPFDRGDLVYVAPFLAFLLSGILAWVHSPFKGWAFEETSRRIFYLVIALIMIAEFRSNERMKRLWRWLMAAAWVAVGYGVVQYLDARYFRLPANGIDPFIWRQAFQHRVFSTFGNPNFYGNFLVILTPLILASILRGKGSLVRPFVMLGLTLPLIYLIDNSTLGIFGGFAPSTRIIVSACIIFLIGAFIFASTWKIGNSTALSFFLILFAMLFLNLYSTETKGAWIGFVASVAITMFLILEYFLHLDEHLIDPKKYSVFMVGFGVAAAALLAVMFHLFVLPLLQHKVEQTGFAILWIPTLLAGVASVLTFIWIMTKPWNLKKVVYGALVFFVLLMGTGILQYAQTRLISVSFRLFTWISTWEMIRTSPVLGSGVGTFKVIYPAFRRPEIIVLEGKSNTETDHSEDEYIETWQDEGIIGFGILLWMIITAIMFGLKQLGWYARIRGPDSGHKRKLLDLESDPRSYEVLGFLGAYMGALVHWTMDVSIRFVSSGIFSGFLPAVLVAYARNHANTIRDEVRMPYERWIRVGVAGFWTAVFLWLGMDLVPANIGQGNTSDTQITLWVVLAGVLLWVLLELLETGNKPERVVPLLEQYRLPSEKAFLPRAALIVLLFGGSLYAIDEFGGHFRADVHHNLAIFFSKNGIWTKSPEFAARMNSFPPDIRKFYDRYCGALEHYEQVNKHNPFFPMAHYFRGNVYNDWGSQKFAESEQARQRGDMSEAVRLRARALEFWDKSEAAYVDTKKLAPNYVQTHHQLGLIYTKRAEQSLMWGEMEKSNQYYDEALRHFRRYWMLDPVFPPNIDRMVQILLRTKNYDEIKKLYAKGIEYNGPISKSINKEGAPQNVGPLAISLAKVNYTQALEKSKDPFHPLLPEVEDAVKYFKVATDWQPQNVEAWKGLGFLLGKMGKIEESQAALRKALALSPNDAELKAGVR